MYWILNNQHTVNLLVFWGAFQKRIYIYELLNLRALKISMLCCIKIISFNFVWNFKGYLWNSTQNILPMHWKRYISFTGENLRALRFKSSQVFLKCPPSFIVLFILWPFYNLWPCSYFRVAMGGQTKPSQPKRWPTTCAVTTALSTTSSKPCIDLLLPAPIVVAIAIPLTHFCPYRCPFRRRLSALCMWL